LLLSSGKKAEDCSADFATPVIGGELLVHVGEYPVSFRSLTQCNLPIPEFWKGKVLRSFVTDSYDQINDYLVFYTLVDLNPTVFNDLLQENRYELIERIDDLIQAVTPPRNCLRVVSGWPKYPSLVYVRPVMDTPEHTEDYIEKAERTAREFRSILNDKSVLVPHFLFDTLLFPSVGPTGTENGLTAVDLSDKPRDEPKPNLFVLPKTVMDVVQYLAGFQIIKHSDNRLKKLPFLSQTLGLYVDRIRGPKEISAGASPDSNPRHRGQRDVSAAYEYEFLNDRIHSSLQRDSVIQSITALAEQLSNNNISRANQIGISQSMDSVISSKSDIAIPILERLINTVDANRAALKGTEELLRTREVELADYLRDLAMADSTRANLNLQRSVWLLTKVAILFAFLSLIIAFLTDDNKKAISSRVVSWIHHLFG
jgi:hypothetical protein